MNRPFKNKHLVLAFLAFALVAQTTYAQGLNEIVKSLTPDEAKPKVEKGLLLIDDGSAGDKLLSQVELKNNLLPSTEFVYQQDRKRDPMVLHWVQYQLTASHKLSQGNSQLSANNLTEAEKNYVYVIALADEATEMGYNIKEMPDYVNQATIGLVRKKLKEAQMAFRLGELDNARDQYGKIQRLVDELKTAGLTDKALDDIQAEVQKGLSDIQRRKEKGAPGNDLPQWVINNTTGMLYEQDAPYVLVGPYTLTVGDMVPEQLGVDVFVEKITKSSVTYRVADKLITISLVEGE